MRNDDSEEQNHSSKSQRHRIITAFQGIDYPSDLRDGYSLWSDGSRYQSILDRLVIVFCICVVGGKS